MYEVRKDLDLTSLAGACVAAVNDVLYGEVGGGPGPAVEDVGSIGQ